MDLDSIPVYYTDLPQDELKLLLYYNQIQLSNSKTEELKHYYLQKIKYISSLIEE